MNKHLLEVFTSIKPPTILVVGDLILDRYVRGKIERISPESPAQVLEVTDESETLGGAGAVAANVSSLGGVALIVGVVGKDKAAVLLRRQLKKWGVKAQGLVADSSRPTTIKTRFISLRQQMLRVDRESREEVSEIICEKMISKIEGMIGSVDGVIVSDYSKGALPPKFLKKLFTVCRKNRKRVIVDPKGGDYSRYRGAWAITPNTKEAEMASGVEIKSTNDCKRAALRLFDIAKVKSIVITRGEEGMTVFHSRTKSARIPAQALEVFDVSGAGDTVIAAISLLSFAGAPLGDAARLANVAAGVEVGHVGAWAVTASELISKLSEKAHGEEKIMNAIEAAAFAAKLAAENKKVVFTNGCFDLLHAGHVMLLERARRFGDALIVGINSDSSIARLKGENRPLLGEEDRLHILSALNCVDGVALFAEDTPLKLIKAIKPGILVKGGDYTPESVVGKEVVEKHGGRVEIIPLLGGKSTSGIIEKILKKHKKQ
ncbi:ADP-heptose synthase / D-glycero-beta-D-manno-heptose 7-phosphate kinase [hydrothermal vent metagenome]|uniref:D-glycero-beta-D-manno-heptose 1-phosphate adenylyltransferase n=1 Tax=hydrothermal vent metagenome TaxID=652676 RepID=A0A3B1D598_9ZZZZ